jgi:hypothetical protein
MGRSYERVHAWEKRLCDTYVRLDEVPTTSTSPDFQIYYAHALAAACARVYVKIEQYTLTLHPSNA